jgi:predicted enzyme related to lactoylglutathione lyase
MNRNPVRWFEIYVQDMGRAKKFYESVLQLTLQKLDTPGIDMWAFPMEMNAPGATGALVRMQGVPSGGSTLVYFASEDCAVEEARVVQSGGQVHKPKFSIGQYGFITLAVDPEGNMFGIHSLK